MKELRRILYGILVLVSLYGLFRFNYLIKMWTGSTLIEWMPLLLVAVGGIYYIGLLVDAVIHHEN
jgi:hypothetical protein